MQVTMIRRWFLLALLLSAAATAQPPPLLLAADQHYRDDDPAARIWFFAVDSATGRAHLDAYIADHPADPRGWSALAYAHALAGEVEACEQALQRAEQRAGSSALKQRRAAWSEGWARLQLGQVESAMRAWGRAYRLHGGHPYWVPASMAVAAELGGRRQQALAWYTLAAKAFPERWTRPDGIARTTAHWRPAEREAMSALAAAWNTSHRAATQRPVR